MHLDAQRKNNNMRNRLTLLAPWIAGLFYGSWAAYSNIEHGNSAALTALTIQGGFAMLSTWLLTSFISWSIQRQHPNPKPWFTFLQTAALLIGIPAIAHNVLGTPDILQAMLPGLIVGNGYSLFVIQQMTQVPATVDS